MNRLTTARLSFAASGIAVWGWGYNHDQPKVRVAGMALMVAALILRWVARRRRDNANASQ